MLFLGMIPISLAWAEETVPLHVYPARLELGFELRMNRFDTSFDRYRSGIEPSVSLGLGWTPHPWVSVHGRVELGMALTLETPMAYRWHNQMLETWHLGSVGLLAAVDIHIPSKLVILIFDVGARSYFAPSRAGMFLVDAGVGVGSEPFHALKDEDVLQHIRFVAGVRFPLVDDFGTIFGHKRTMPVVTFGVVLGY